MPTPPPDLAALGATFGQVCRLTGLTARRVDYATRTGVIRASVLPAAGKGSARVYALRDVVALRAVGQLRDAGVSLPKIRKAVRTIKQHWPEVEDPLASLTLVTDGCDVLAVVPESEAGELLMSLAMRPGQLAVRAVMIRISAIAAEMRTALDLERKAAAETQEQAAKQPAPRRRKAKRA